MEHYLAIKRNMLLLHGKTLINLENTLIDRKLTEMNTSFMSLLI